jgi:membrane-bound serine protease (ClpP class)
MLRASRMLRLRLPSLAALLAAALAAALSARAEGAPQAVVLDINSAIGPAVADYMTRELRAIDPQQTRVVVVRMNTPGGLDSSMRTIIAAILASPVPVVAYVAPSGARAASAGTYITYAAALAAMAPGTNLGAATPIALLGAPEPSGKQPESGKGAAGAPADAETRKIVNDAVAYIRGLAQLNGRNADWAEQAVRQAVSLPAQEALKLHVVDVIAGDLPDLLRQIDGRRVIVDGKPAMLRTAGLAIVARPPDWRTDFLATITDPNIAFILLLLGIAGLVFEFTTPGAVAPGLVGAISLLLALFALDLLPIDYAGAALVLLGVGLMIAEAHLGAFGVLGVAGIAAFVMGALIMFPASAPGFTLSRPLLAAVTLVAAGFFLVALSLLLRSRRRPVVSGREALIGAEGEAVSWDDGEGRVRIGGEIWRARASRRLPAGTRVKVVGRQGLVLSVEPL